MQYLRPIGRSRRIDYHLQLPIQLIKQQFLLIIEEKSAPRVITRNSEKQGTGGFEVVEIGGIPIEEAEGSFRGKLKTERSRDKGKGRR